ncbi:MAG: HAMP domain-containing sensor histidine kinase [Proteobacteria bacterium]|nr:HAMP domain-containing sensor histidine kinase [Pseudomonadota bacterium]
MLFPSSLRQKITFGYLLVAVLILAVSLFTFESLKRVEARILLSERISGLFETAMEVRRFERNYFLHGQAADLSENADYINRLEAMLNDDLALPEAHAQIEVLREKTRRYRQQVGLYAAASANSSQRRDLEQKVRATGKELVSITEMLVQTERQLLQSSLASFRITLVFIVVGLALFMIALGQALSRRVAFPLQQMEDYVAAISAGRRDTLPFPSQDREIVSITLAFNHMLKELELRQKHLLRSEKLASLGTLLSGVAHELNNPLSNIWTSCQILQEESVDADQAHQQILLAQIDEQCERARHIVSSLQDFARERHFGREHFSLRQLMEQTLRFIKAEIPAHLAITLHIDDTLYLYADRQRLQQVFLNLIKNALDASPGSIEIAARRRAVAEVATEADCDVTGDTIDISIQDSGAGMSAECMSRIFDPFFTTKDVGHGMGLGLFIVYQIIEEHEGCITVSSSEGQGTTFLIRLPVDHTRGQDAEAG